MAYVDPTEIDPADYAYVAELGDAFLFDESTLRANLAGRLSAEQTKTLKTGSTNIGLWANIIVGTISLAVMLNYWLTDAEFEFTEILASFFGVVAALGIPYYLLERRRIARSNKPLQVRLFTGPLGFDLGFGVADDAHNKFTVGGMRQIMTHGEHEALKPYHGREFVACLAVDPSLNVHSTMSVAPRHPVPDPQTSGK